MDDARELAAKALTLLLEAKTIKFEKMITADSDRLEKCMEETSVILEKIGNGLGANRKKKLSYNEFCTEDENEKLKNQLDSRLAEINTISDSKVQKILKTAFFDKIADEIDNVTTLVDSSDENIEKELDVEKDFMRLFKDYVSEDNPANKMIILSDIAALEAWWIYYDTKLSSFVILFLINEVKGKLIDNKT